MKVDFTPCRWAKDGAGVPAVGVPAVGVPAATLSAQYSSAEERGTVFVSKDDLTQIPLTDFNQRCEPRTLRG